MTMHVRVNGKTPDGRAVDPRYRSDLAALIWPARLGLGTQNLKSHY